LINQYLVNMSSSPLRIGFVPEHFSTPLYFAQKHFGLDATLIPFPSGTGHMVTAIRSGEIDVAVGLTEGWIAGLGKEGVEGDGGYRLVGTYVETPLCKPLPFHDRNLTTNKPSQAGPSLQVQSVLKSHPSTLSRAARLACHELAQAAT
jgi:hypothetical protein